MAFEDRIATLRMKHQALEAELRQEARRPVPDPAVTGRLKREKLRLKDEINRLARA